MGKTSSKVKNRYNAKTYDSIILWVKKGQKDVIKEHAQKHDGGSVNAFIKRAVKEAMDRDESKEEDN